MMGKKNKKDNCYKSLKKVKTSMIIKPNNCWNQVSECTITLGPDNRSTGLHSSKTWMAMSCSEVTHIKLS